MDLPTFLRALRTDGAIRFDSAEPPSFEVGEEASAIHELEFLDTQLRLDAPASAPPFRTEPGLWAARQLYRISQFLVFREVPASRIELELAELCPGEAGPVRTWSVDLTLQRLPELLRRASRIASADPLVEQLQRMAWEWPLSSMGVELALESEDAEDGLDLTAILEHASLRQLYVDRVLRTQDASRLYHPVVRRQVEEAVGAFPELAGDLVERGNV